MNSKISFFLEKAYEDDELQLKKKIEAIIESGTFKPCEYGQDVLLADCPFKKSIEKLQALNKVISPFEIVMTLQKTHKEIVKEIEEFSLSLGKDISINGDIAIASLMTVFLSGKILHPLKWTTYAQYFSYINNNIGEIGILNNKQIAYMVTNFVVVVENFRQMPVNITAKISEFEEVREDKEIDLKSIIVSNFFTKKKREVKEFIKMKNIKTNDFENESSDRDTNVSHPSISKTSQKR